MATIIIEIDSCRACPNFKEGVRQTTDGFDSGNDWFCKKVVPEKMIAVFVEWMDKPEIPKWCPIKTTKRKK